MNVTDAATQRLVLKCASQYEPFLSMLIDESKKDTDVRCRVGTSAIHGLGLFAVRDIHKGEVITHYPAHGFVLSKPGTPLSDDGERLVFGAVIIDSPMVGANQTQLRSPTDEDRKSYHFAVQPDLNIIGYPDMTDSHLLLGHMANDAVAPSDDTYNHAGEVRYTHAALASNNAGFEKIAPGIVGMIASRPIRVGEEITVTYGYRYWVSINFTGTRS